MRALRYITSLTRYTTLAIESSCDDSCIALMSDVSMEKKTTHHSLNRAFNGVFPFIMAACHEISLSRNLQLLISGHTEKIENICYTAGPGQQQSLARGFFLAKIAASAFKSRLIPVHHMEGHIYSADIPSGQYPFLAILLSGGHTLIVLVISSTEYTIMSRSVDDNIGEAYDKVAREIPFKLRGADIGGSSIERLAKMCYCDKSEFYDSTSKPNTSYFSFSGIKTEVLKDISTAQSDADCYFIVCKFQRSVIKNLQDKMKGCLQILEEMNITPAFITLGGGVSLNEAVKETIESFAARYGMTAYSPCRELSTDNASMIAKACKTANMAQRSLSGQLNPIADFPLGFIKDDDDALAGYISM